MLETRRIGVVLWEALAGERLFRGEDAVSTMDAVYTRIPARLAERGIAVPAAVDDVLARALAKEASGRYDTADAMARSLEAALPPASDHEIAEWVDRVAGDVLAARVAQVADFEGDDTGRSVARLYPARPSEPTTARREGSVGSARSVPMVMPAAGTEAKRRGPSVFHLALLVVFPPLLVAIALTGGRSSGSVSGSSSGSSGVTEANAESTPATAVTTPPVMGAAPSLVAEPPPPAASTSTTTTGSAASGAHVPPRQERKTPRPVPHRKTARPLPVAVSR